MKFLSKPHPFIFNTVSVALPGSIAFLIILVMAPLGFDDFPFQTRFYLGCLFGAIASTTVFLNVQLLLYAVPTFMSEDTWTVLKELILIFWVIITICLANFLVVLMLDFPPSSLWETFREVVIYTCIISFFPVLLMVLTEQYYHQKKKLKEAQKLTEIVSENKRKQVQEKESKVIELKAENGAVELSLKPELIYFIQSDGNYAEVFYKEESGEDKKVLIRNRLKYFAKDLPTPPFVQCHKSYIVNSARVSTVSGNARNFELILSGVAKRIPVSRSRINELKIYFGMK